MPLIHGKSQKAFEHNLKTEMHEGKPMAQSLAIAYSMKRKAKRKKMADGGTAPSPTPSLVVQPHQFDADAQDYAKRLKEKQTASSGQAAYAEGGDVKGVHEPFKAKVGPGKGQSRAGDEARWAQATRNGMPATSAMHSHNAKKEHERVLSEMKSMPKPHGEYAQGGIAGAHEEDNKDLNQHLLEILDSAKQDIVDRIMHQRSMTYEDEARLAEGGEVEEEHDELAEHGIPEHGYGSSAGAEANDDDILAGFERNEFDDLHLRDDFNASYPGKENLGSAREDDDREDIVSKIMRSRAKKDRNPRPA